MPFGTGQAGNHYIQFLIPGAALGTVKRDITGVGFAPASSTLRDIKELTITVRQTKVNTLTADRLGAVSGFTTSAQYGRVQWSTTGNQWNRLPLRYPFDPAAGNLLVEIFCVGAFGVGSGDPGFRQDASLQSITASGWGFQPPRQCTLGTGAPRIELCFDAGFFTVFDDSSCLGSNRTAPRLSFAGSPRLGNTAHVDLSGASGTSGLAVLIWGFRHIAADGLDLTIAGAPGCVLRMRIDFVFGYATQNGAARASIPLPNDSGLIGIDPVGFQWFPYDPSANRLQFVSSNWGFLRFGH